MIERNGIVHRFEPSDRAVVRTVRDLRPDVVHVHGLGFVTLLARLCRSLDRHVAIVVQHHGEPPGPWRNRQLHRLVRRRVDGYLFTGADDGQAEPFRAAGCSDHSPPPSTCWRPPAPLPPEHVRRGQTPADILLQGSPAVLWVGRLIAGKDPLGAVDAVARRCTPCPTCICTCWRATPRWPPPRARTRRASALRIASISIHRYRRARCTAGTALPTCCCRPAGGEGSNYSLIEAMTHGCPPAVTDIASHRSITRDLGHVSVAETHEQRPR